MSINFALTHPIPPQIEDMVRLKTALAPEEAQKLICLEGESSPEHIQKCHEGESSPEHKQRRHEGESSPERPRKRLEKEPGHPRNLTDNKTCSDQKEKNKKRKRGQRVRGREQSKAKQPQKEPEDKPFPTPQQWEARRINAGSKKEKRMALSMATMKIKSWLDILKATWTTWTPQTQSFARLQQNIRIGHLPRIEAEEVKSLMETIRETPVSMPWNTDVDMLIGLVLVVEADIFDLLWKEFALEISAWLRGATIRQLTRKIELRERLEIQGSLFEEMENWKERQERRQSNKVIPQQPLPSNVVQSGNQGEAMGATTEPKELEDEPMPLVRGGVSERCSHTPPVTYTAPPLKETPRILQSPKSSEEEVILEEGHCMTEKAMATEDIAAKKTTSLPTQRRRSRKIVVGSSSESEKETPVPKTATQQTKAVATDGKHLVQQVLSQIVEPHGSLILEGVHARSQNEETFS
jgi:hypothetical protein